MTEQEDLPVFSKLCEMNRAHWLLASTLCNEDGRPEAPVLFSALKLGNFLLATI